MVWTQNLAIGVDEIDNQHKIWFEKADRLFEAGKNHQAKEYIGELLSFLESYTKTHFEDEEKFMESINYPYLSEQKIAHAAFIKQVADLKSEYNASGGNILVILNANQMMINWLTSHISRLDRKIGEYVKAKQL